MPKHWGVLGRRRIRHSHSNHHGNQHRGPLVTVIPTQMLSVSDLLALLCLSGVADGRHVHPWLQVLLGEDGPSAATSGPKRALQHGQGHRRLGPGLCGSHLG